MKPRHVAELELSGAALACLEAIGIASVDQLVARHPATDLANHPLVGGMELYEIVCRLNEHGHSLPMYPTFTTMPATDREREMLRLRLVDGLSLTEIGTRLGVAPGWVRHVLDWHFGLRGKPPAVKARKRLRKRARPG
jgi:DNA-binding NarL/FixJ family response regulator